MAIEPIKGFYLHDVETDTDGVAKYDAGALENLDRSLTERYRAPDSKAVGDRLSAVEAVADEANQIAERLNEGGLELKDEVLAENISAWLNEHPEATTTVEDGALVQSKLSDTLDARKPSFYSTVSEMQEDEQYRLGATAISDGAVYTVRSAVEVNDPEDMVDPSVLYKYDGQYYHGGLTESDRQIATGYECVNGFAIFVADYKNAYVTPEMFGAVGDGVTDDTAAFHALAGKVAVIPAKTYVVSSVTYPRKTRLYGSGMGCTIIQQKSGATGDLFNFADADRSALKNVSLYGNKDELDTNIYRALLKIRVTRTSQNVDYSHYSNYEHIHIRNAPSSGIVLLGRTNTDPVYPNSNYNWVLHFDDLRVEECNNWCMIDETSDNLFSNLYLNEGDLGNFKCGSSSNMYCNLKLDQPYGGGNRGQLSGFDDGCLLLLKNATNNRFVNADIQSACYVGVKVYNSRGIHMDGDINNCGLGADGHGIGLLIESSNNCTFNLEFHKVNAETEYNAKINTGCTDIMVYANQADETETPNACPETCFILNQERLANVYNSTISKTMAFNNLIQNPLCADKTWWGFSNTDNITVDTSSKTAGVNSFKVVGDRNKNIMIYKNYTSLTPGDFYLMTAVVNTETVSTSYSAIGTSTMYTLMATGGADSNIYYRHKYSPRETGKSLIMQVGKVASAGDLQARYYCYNNDGVYYIGNFLLINLRDLGIANPASINTYDALYQKLVDIMNDPFTSVSMTWDYQNIMGLLNYLMHK